MTRSLRALTTGIALLGAVAACRRPEAAAPGGPAKLKVIIEPFLSYGPLLLAQAYGDYAALGLEVEFVRVNETSDAIPALLTGRVDVLPGLPVPALLSAMARGERIRFVADKAYLKEDACTQIAVLLRPGLDSTAAVTGMKRFAMRQEAPMRYMVTRALERAGVDVGRLELVNIPSVPMGQALADGVIDGAHAGEPWLSRFVRSGEAVAWLPLQRALPNHQLSFIIFGPRLLDREPEVGQRFLAAYRRGIARFEQGKTPRNLEILTRETGQDRAVLEATCWPVFQPGGRINLASLLEYQRWAMAQGLLDTEAPAAMVWDSSFVAASDRWMGTFEP